MVGTEKQISWAVEIRDNALAEIDLTLLNSSERGATAAQMDQACAGRDKLADQSDAGWWIERRVRSGRELLVEAMKG